MLTRSTVTADSAPPGRGSLLDRVERFALTDPRGGRASWTSLRVGDAVITKVDSSGHVIGAASDRAVTLLATTRGVMSVEQGGGTLRARAGGAVVLRPGFRLNAAAPCSGGVGVAFGSGGPDDGTPGIEIARIADNPAAMSLLGFAAYALAEADRPGSPFLGPRSQRAAKALIADAAAALGLAFETGLAPGAAHRARRVKAALAFMRANADEPLAVEEVARAVRVGPRTLQSAFHDELGVSPRACLTEIRLERARARLIAPEAATTVSTAALDSGFVHLGRFAAAYRARFGESPSTTLRRATGRG